MDLPGYFYGFNYILVIILYVAIIAVLLLIHCAKSYYRKKKAKKNQEENFTRDPTDELLDDSEKNIASSVKQRKKNI
jgi:FtsZ-interacting cell division protein ZipA